MLRISRTVALVMALCVGLTVAAQEPTETSPQDRVDEVFADWDSTRGPGCAVSVIKDGEIVYKRGYGMANLDHDVPIRTDTIFHVASISKEFTAASIALLAMDGKLSLDDPIQKHLPWVPDFGHLITIRNLIHHNSGIRDQWSLLQMSGWRYSEDRITDDDVIFLLKKQRDLNFLPGERYLYSNSGYTLMAQIVKAVSGQSLREFTTERIFEPLGMTRTHFRDDFSEIVRGQAYGYRWDDETAAFRLSVTNFDTVGATSLLTTVEDMARWDRNFIEPRVGGQELLDLIHQRGTLNSGEEQNYAFGLSYGTYRGLATVGHGGADAGYRANFVRFPDQGYSFAALGNFARANPGGLARQVADIYLEDHFEPADPDESAEASEPAVVELAEADAARIEGVYWFDEQGVALRFDRDEDGLGLSVGSQRFETVHTGNGVFSAPQIGVLLRFEPAAGAVERVLLWPPDDENDVDEADKLPAYDTDNANLSDYVGDYASPELPVTYHLEIDEGQLTIHWLKSDREDLMLATEDLLFGDDVGSLRFQRDASGAITGFILDSGRVRNFRFERVR